jgi:hypothetical protein
MQKQLGDSRAHQRAVAPLLFVAGELIQLVRNLAVEERGKPRIALDQADGHALGARVAERLLARHECVAAFAVDEGAAVEAVLGAEQCQQIAAVALFDGALDDHEQGAGGRILGDDGFAGAKVGDIQCRTQGLDLLRCQAVERRVGGIEGVGHCFPDQIPASPELDAGRPRMIQTGGLSPRLKRRPSTLAIAVQLRAAYGLALRFSIRSSTTLGSARVEVSPRLPNSLSAILRRMRRMIFPERVFGRPGAN